MFFLIQKRNLEILDCRYIQKNEALVNNRGDPTGTFKWAPHEAIVEELHADNGQNSKWSSSPSDCCPSVAGSSEIFSFSALENAWNNAKLPSEREHVTPYFYNNKNKFKIFNYENEKNISKFRYAVDRIEDLELVKILMSRIKKRPIVLEDILEQFNADPSLININKDIDYYEGYEKSKKEDIDFLNSKNKKNETKN